MNKKTKETTIEFIINLVKLDVDRAKSLNKLMKKLKRIANDTTN